MLIESGIYGEVSYQRWVVQLSERSKREPRLYTLLWGSTAQLTKERRLQVIWSAYNLGVERNEVVTGENDKEIVKLLDVKSCRLLHRRINQRIKYYLLIFFHIWCTRA